MRVERAIEPNTPSMPGRIARALVLAATQAISNAAQHAGGSGLAVVVDGSADPAGVRITVRDTGAGFDLDRVPHDRLGIRASIFARVAAVGGTSSIDSDPDGTTVRLEWRESRDMISVRQIIVGLGLAFTAYLAARGLWWTATGAAAARRHRGAGSLPRDDVALHLLGAAARPKRRAPSGAGDRPSDDGVPHDTAVVGRRARAGRGVHRAERDRGRRRPRRAHRAATRRGTSAGSAR